MSTRYLLTLCTALIVGWALITGWMSALGKVVVENPPVAESWLKVKSPTAMFADWQVNGQQLDVENTKGVVMSQGMVDFGAAKPAAVIAKSLDGVKSEKNALREEGTPSTPDAVENSQDSGEFDGKGRRVQPGSLHADRVKMTIFSLGLLTMRPLGHG
jgi:hypothetical protein